MEIKYRIPENTQAVVTNENGFLVIVVEEIGEFGADNTYPDKARDIAVSPKWKSNFGNLKWYKHSSEDIYSLIDFNRELFAGFTDGHWSEKTADANDLKDFNFGFADISEVEKLMIAKAEKYKGAKIRNMFLKGNTKVLSKSTDIFMNKEGVFAEDGNNYTLWTPKKGWAEIIEPLFINSNDTNFHKGDTVYWVCFKDLKIHNGIIDDYDSEDWNGVEGATGMLTKEQAEQYVRDNRVFEDECFYGCNFQGNISVCQYDSEMKSFEVLGAVSSWYSTDFSSIGEKIDFQTSK